MDAPEASSPFADNSLSMSEVGIRAKLLAWGNSYGLRLSAADVERLSLVPGREVKVAIAIPARGKPRRLPSFHLGGRLADEHDEAFGRSGED
jgi:antitoxin component of MazEF toxin-antitoxin module